MNETAKHVIFRGRVQGVGFRYTVHSIARRYDICGFVKNLPDGTVELLAQGPAHEVDGCIEDIEGAFSGYIRDKKVEQVACHSRYTDFQIAF